jgi:hypothetical protein
MQCLKIIYYSLISFLQMYRMKIYKLLDKRYMFNE